MPPDSNEISNKLAFQISRAEPADFPLLWDLQRNAYATESKLYEQPIPPMKQSLEEAVADCRRNLVLKACVDKQIVGSIRARLEEKTCLISKLMVLPAFRRCGVGTALIKAIEAAFPGSRFELFTGMRSTGNIRLYQMNGYRTFRTDPEPGLVFMEKPASGGAI